MFGIGKLIKHSFMLFLYLGQVSKNKIRFLVDFGTNTQKYVLSNNSNLFQQPPYEMKS